MYVDLGHGAEADTAVSAAQASSIPERPKGKSFAVRRNACNNPKKAA